MGLRFLAYSVPFILLCAALAVLAVNLRATENIRRQLSDLDTRISQLSSQTESDINGLSREIKDLSGGMQKEIVSSRRSTRGEFSRMGNGLSGRLDEMARQMKELAASPQPAVVVSTVSAESNDMRQEAPARETPAEQPTAPAAPPPAADRTASAATTATELNASAATTASVSPAAPTEQDLSAARRMKEGLALYESRRYGQAQKSFLAAIESQADNVDARLYYAASLYRANPSDTANYPLIEKNLRQVMNTDAENPLALETVAMVEIERQKWTDALVHLRLLAALQPGNAAILKTAGYCALKIADIAAAKSYFEAASRQSPADAEALSSLGDCELSLGNASQAEQDWKAALSALDQGTAAGSRASRELYVKRARAAYARGDYGECLALAKEGQQRGRSALLQAYEGLSLAAGGSAPEGQAILRRISSSSDSQAAALARQGIQEAQQ